MPRTPRSRRVADYTDRYVSILTPPPPAGEGVCDVCHNAPNPGWARCYSCHEAMSQVSRPLELVVPISLYRRSTQLHRVLWGYKNLKDGTARTFRTQLAALLYRFLGEHGECIEGTAGGAWEVITTVPSSSEREGLHPLERAIDMAAELRAIRQPLLRRGDVATGHNAASDDGFETITDVDGLDVLLVDDTFTSGARLQSAASRLALDGANVVAAVVVGRFCNPGFSTQTQELWDAAEARRFSFDVCCLEG